jgi:hypothetical protein
MSSPTQAAPPPAATTEPARKVESFPLGTYPSLAGLAAMGSDEPSQLPPLRDQIDAALDQYRRYRECIYELSRSAGAMPPDAVAARARLLYPPCRLLEETLGELMKAAASDAGCQQLVPTVKAARTALQVMLMGSPEELRQGVRDIKQGRGYKLEDLRHAMEARRGA